jgi:hypothetical protein
MSLIKVGDSTNYAEVDDDGKLTASGGVTGVISGTVAGDLAVAGTSTLTGVVTATAGVVGDITATSTVILKDRLGKILIAQGTTVPVDTGTLYAKGCLFIDTDVATGTSGLYVNVGTSESCVFKLVSNA